MALHLGHLISRGGMVMGVPAADIVIVAMKRDFETFGSGEI